MITTANNKISDKVGAVLVIGGGIAGIQASLDLAESGQMVYLLESSPAIGGNMARLDKTFPTNDCSMCILSPKIVECGRHLNIETITWSDLEGFEGTAGNFTAKIKRRARYVDLKKCTGCGECANACPVKAESEFDADMGERKGIFRPCPQAYPNAFVIDKKGKSPCRVGCPAGININGYVALAGAGKFDEALQVVLETVPLPGVLGRVCDHPCEKKCHVGSKDNPVSICAIKRFLADRRLDGKMKYEAPKVEQKLEKIAIIGSGPAGLTAARDLAQKGYKPVIFEAAYKAGGMLAWGIPDYRLPADVLEREIKMDVLDFGAELKLNTKIGKDVTVEQLYKDGFKAVILADGAQMGSGLGVDGENTGGGVDCIEFLRDASGPRKIKVGKKVTVIGGGNTAIDSARTALRLGAEKVTIVYRRTRAEMPAIDFEIEAAEKEGVEFMFLSAPTKVVSKDGNACGLECVQMKLGDPDASGRRSPVKIKGSEFVVETDMIIPAIGQQVDLVRSDSILKNLKMSKWGTIESDSKTSATNVENIFAIGDAANGPQSVIKAMAEGKKAANAVGCFLRGVKFEPLAKLSEADVTPELPTLEDYSGTPRQHAAEIAVEERIKTFDEVESALTEEQVLEESGRCMKCAICSECMACVKACKANAIDHTQKDIIEEKKVGAVIVVPGFEEYLAKLNYDYGFSSYEDVITSMQFERILSASGPFGGHVQRPSDGKEPKKIAFLQCVGSRDTCSRNGYCSSVCCMYAIKEAVIAKEHMKNVDVTIFFMDMRAFGKDFDKYYERAKAEYGVKFVRARVSDVSKKNGQQSLTVQYSPEEGGVSKEEFDLVVLSTGLEPSVKGRKLAQTLGLRLEKNGFIWTEPSNPLRTSRPGIFAAGASSGPKDIPETVTQASGAACEAGRQLWEVRNTLTTERQYPTEKDIAGLEPRVGVFVCHCGINIGGIVNVPTVAEFIKTVPGVVYAEENLYTCSQDTQDHIKEMILKHDMNRVVVASCSPRTHEALFQQTLKEAGLNPHLFEMANIRDQCSWIHMNEPAKATEKAKDLVKMAVAKVCCAEPLSVQMIDITHSAVVIGGGLAGMTAALAIADQGFDVTIVEKEKTLGGNLKKVKFSYQEPNMQQYLDQLSKQVLSHERINVYTDAQLEVVEGFVGNFKSMIKTNQGPMEVKHGAVIVATGGNENKPKEYCYGLGENVLTQLELEDKLAKNDALNGVKSVVMIQCVGSREKGHMYCSRVCCNTAVKNAIKIKELSPATEVYVLYRDIRTYGFTESYYQQARDAGVIFIRYDIEAKPKVENNNGLAVSIKDTIAGEEIVLNPDMLVLSSRIDPNPNNEHLAKMLKVPVNEDRFFLEAHVKLRPVEFATEGIFVAGLAHCPKSMPETIAQAQAAASKAVTIISKDKYQAEPKISNVDTSLCAACGACVDVCAYKAVELVIVDEKRGIIAAKVNPALCKGCGACAAACRSGAADIKGITDQQIDLMIEAL